MKGLAGAILPKAKVFSGTPDQLSQNTINEDFPIIGIVTGFDLDKGLISASTKQASIMVYFGIADSFESTSEETDNIIASMEILSDQFLEKLEPLSIDYRFQITTARQVPFFKAFGSTYSGMLVEMEVQAGVCDVNIFPDLATYQNEISRKITPYNWQGITKRT